MIEIKKYKIFLNLIYENGMIPTITGFNLTTCDLYFTVLLEVFINLVLAKNIYFMNHLV